jgi:lipoprotein signal peptidase
VFLVRRRENNKRLAKLLLASIYLVSLLCFERLVRLLFIRTDNRNYNTQIIWGMVHAPYCLSFILGLGVMLMVTVVLARTRIWFSWISLLAILFIIIGLVVNLHDWLVFGGIWDYLSVWNMYFNLADIYIIIGLLLFTVQILKNRNIINEE